MTRDVADAVAAGLAIRDLEQPAGDTLACARTVPGKSWRVGLTPEEEGTLLAAWQAHHRE